MTEQQIETLVGAIQKEFDGNLLAVVLYGSQIKNAHQKNGRSDLLVILREISLSALADRKWVVEEAAKKYHAQILFWTEEELLHSADVFPVEFLDIMENRKVLWGTDLFADITIDTRNLRHQIEFELRSKLLGFRMGWIGLQGRMRTMEEQLGRAGNSFLHLVERAEKSLGVTLPSSAKETLHRAVQLKKKEIRLAGTELEALYHEVHESVEEAVQYVERIKN